MEEIQAQTRTLAQVGNPLLGQIHDFIQSDEPAPMDPLGLVTRAVRGRVRHIGILAMATAALFALLAWVVIDPLYQSTAAVRILPRKRVHHEAAQCGLETVQSWEQHASVPLRDHGTR